MRWRLALVMASSVLATGCTADVLGRLSGFDVMRIVQSAQVAEAVQKGRTIGASFAGIEALILAFVSWYRIHAGGSWLSVTKDWVVGILACALILASAGTVNGLEQWIWRAGVYLGEQFSPSKGFLMENYDRAVAQNAEMILTLHNAPVTPGSDDSRVVEALAWQLSMPYTAVLIAINSMAIYIMKMVMQVSYAWLISFYWMAAPLVAPMVILPQTRNVFIGWLRTYVSVALWPMFFAFAERLALAIPWNAWIGATQGAAGAWNTVVSITQSQIMLLIFNVTFLFVYLSIPIASHLMVSGASRPFRTL